MNDRRNGKRLAAPIAETDLEILVQLWRTVILQAVADAKSKTAKITDKNAAIRWLSATSDKSNFATVCDLANVDFHETRTRIAAILADPALTYDFRCIRREKTAKQSKETRSHYFRRIERNARRKKSK